MHVCMISEGKFADWKLLVVKQIVCSGLLLQMRKEAALILWPWNSEMLIAH